MTTIAHAGPIDVGAALRIKYESEQAVTRSQKTQSRLNRWAKRDKIIGQANLNVLDVMVSANQFWLVVVSPTLLVVAQILGVFQTYKNGYKPFKKLPLVAIERLQLKVFTQVKQGEWKFAGFAMCFTAQQMVCYLPTESVQYDMVKRTVLTCAMTTLNVEQFLPQMPFWWRTVVQGDEQA